MTLERRQTDLRSFDLKANFLVSFSVVRFELNGKSSRSLNDTVSFNISRIELSDEMYVHALPINVSEKGNLSIRRIKNFLRGQFQRIFFCAIFYLFGKFFIEFFPNDETYTMIVLS